MLIGKTGKIRSLESVEDLLKVSIKDIRLYLEMYGYDLQEIISGYGSGKTREVSGTLVWTRTYRIGKCKKIAVKTGDLAFSLGKDSEGVYINLRLNGKDSEQQPMESRYYLISKESNLKPGTYLYYFLDPYSDEDPGLCRKLYFFRGHFYPRSLLRSFGVLYRQQREGHTQRYVYTFMDRVPDEWRKFGKTHYRGKITPGYERYLHLVKESDRRHFEQENKVFKRRYGVSLEELC